MNNQPGMNRALGLASALLVIAAALPAQSLDLPPGRWWENERLAGVVGLSADQQLEIADLVYSHALRMIDLNAGVERSKLALEQQVDRHVVDPAAIRKAFTAFQEARHALETERFEMLLAVRQILTREQWNRLTGLRERLDRIREHGLAPGDHPRAPDPRVPGRPPRPGGFPERSN